MQKLIWVDYLRVLAIVAVVTIHSTAFAYNNFNHIPLETWWFANVLNGLSRFSVPMFVMISGFLLLGRHVPVKEFYIKRSLRLFPALIFWSLFFVVCDYFANDRTISFVMWSLTGNMLVNGNAYFHLWYLTMFICLMMFVPFINSYVTGKKPLPEELVYLISALAVFLLLNQASFTAKKLFGYNMEWFKNFPWYVAYFIAGYFLGNYYERINIGNKAAISLLFLLLATSIGLNYFSTANGIIDDSFILNNKGIVTFVVTALIFYLFVSNKDVFKEHKIISSVANASFGIYLLHPFFLKLFNFPLISLVDNLSVAIVFQLLVSFTLSYFIIFSLRKIKLFRYLC